MSGWIGINIWVRNGIGFVRLSCNIRSHEILIFFSHISGRFLGLLGKEFKRDEAKVCD